MSYPTIVPPTFTYENISDALKYLETNGYVVFTSVLTTSEKTEFSKLFEADMKILSPKFSTTNKETWSIANYPGMFGKGICVFNGIGHADFMWYLRTNSVIQGVFKELYSTRDLVTSFDGCSIFCSNKQKSKSWHHVDQNPKNPIQSYQASYNLYPVTERSSGFVLAPKSHSQFVPQVTHSKDWIVLDKDSEWHSKVVKLLIPGNCLTVWNSKTIHANTGMEKKYENIALDRLTCYITYLPKILRPESVRRERLNGYRQGVTTSHWANKYEPKRYPYGFKKQHEKKLLGSIVPKVDGCEKTIPEKRLELI